MEERSDQGNAEKKTRRCYMEIADLIHKGRKFYFRQSSCFEEISKSRQISRGLFFTREAEPCRSQARPAIQPPQAFDKPTTQFYQARRTISDQTLTLTKCRSPLNPVPATTWKPLETLMFPGAFHAGQLTRRRPNRPPAVEPSGGPRERERHEGVPRAADTAWRCRAPGNGPRCRAALRCGCWPCRCADR